MAWPARATMPPGLGKPRQLAWFGGALSSCGGGDPAGGGGDVDSAAQCSQPVGYALQAASLRGGGRVEALAVIGDEHSLARTARPAEMDGTEWCSSPSSPGDVPVRVRAA